MTIVLIPKFVLTGRHHHNGEKEILKEQPIFRSLIRIKKKQWLEVRIPFYLFCCFRMLCSELKDMKVSVFHHHLVLEHLDFYLCLVIFFFNEKNMRND